MKSRVEHFNIQRIIWNEKSWRPSTGFTDFLGANPHKDHLHVEVDRASSEFNNARPKCDGGDAGCPGDCPPMTAFLQFLGGPKFKDPFTLLPVRCINLGSALCRKVLDENGNPTDDWSAHAYGTAVDMGVGSIDDGNQVRDWLFAPMEGGGFLADLSDEEQKFIADFIIGLANGFWVGTGKPGGQTPAIQTGSPPTQNERALGFAVGRKLAELT
jgi:hypothetical protein